ncbi:TPA: Ldh family oxidoreductase [Bacillus cereus]|nr:Ldh family oxidoreductase [Bacillus cereus]HDR8493508.1 Ldh family oxidoreductase [Bacillus cereus]
MKLLVNKGTPLDIAEIVVSHLITSEMEGHLSHGILRILEYVKKIENGLISVKSSPTIQKVSNLSSMVIGNKSFGALTLNYAIEELLEILKKQSIAIVGIQESNHLGRIGHLTSQISSKGFITLGFVNYMGGGQNVPVWKGTEGRFCTNPITIGFPKTSLFDSIVIDMSTSNAAEGKIRKHKIYNQALSDETLIDKKWNYVNNPDKFYKEPREVFLAPLGGKNYGYKGYALALAVEILAGILTNSGFSQESSKDNDGNGGLFIAIKPDILGISVEKVLSDIEDLISYLYESETLEKSVLLPGERSRKLYKKNESNGYLAIKKQLWDKILFISGEDNYAST